MPLLNPELRAALDERLDAFRAYSSTRVPQGNGFKALLTGGVAAVAAIFLWPDSGATVTTELVEDVTVPGVDLSRYDMALDADFAALPREVRTVTLEPGDNLGPMLQREGLSGPEAHRFTQAFAEEFSPRRLRAGQSFDLHFTGDVLSDVTFKPNVERTVFVSRSEDGWSARSTEAEFRYETVGVRATIGTSLYVDATRLGAPDKVVQQFANIYEYSVDFQRDIQPGDGFEMFFEVARDGRGEIVKAGDLLFTSFSPRGKTSDYWLFEDADGRENFYSADGKTAKRKLRATPINGARLSSGYGRRKHPILGYRKMHAGVDFAAPTGTPILAAGSGTVERANRYGGYGNYIRIRHTDGYKTAYAHLSKFARGVKAGAYVTQDQVIGYVGSTGRSTGPHLHYEVHHHGKKINPRKLSQLSGKPLAKSQMAAFAERRAEIEAMRQASEVITPAPATAVMAEALPR